MLELRSTILVRCYAFIPSLTPELYGDRQIAFFMPVPIFQSHNFALVCWQFILFYAGTVSSPASILLAQIASFFEVPVVGATATSDELSDKYLFPYYHRIVPPDRYQVRDLFPHTTITLFPGPDISLIPVLDSPCSQGTFYYLTI